MLTLKDTCSAAKGITYSDMYHSICAHVLFRTLNSIKLLCVSCGRHSASKFAFVWTEIREFWRLILMEFETAIKLMVICFWEIRKY